MSATRTHAPGRRLLVVVLVAMLSMLALPAGANAAGEDCGAGVMDFVQGSGMDVVMIEAVRISGLGAACEGQVVGLRFLGNSAGDPDLPTTILAQSYSDEDPCTGQDLAVPGVVTGGVVDILLCESSATAGFVNGHDLTDARAITPMATVAGTAAPGAAPNPAPDAAPDAASDSKGPLAATGAQGLMLAVIGALALLLGAGMLRVSRRRLTH